MFIRDLDKASIDFVTGKASGSKIYASNKIENGSTIAIILLCQTAILYILQIHFGIVLPMLAWTLHHKGLQTGMMMKISALKRFSIGFIMIRNLSEGYK